MCVCVFAHTQTHTLSKLRHYWDINLQIESVTMRVASPRPPIVSPASDSRRLIRVPSKLNWLSMCWCWQLPTVLTSSSEAAILSSETLIRRQRQQFFTVNGRLALSFVASRRTRLIRVVPMYLISPFDTRCALLRRKPTGEKEKKRKGRESISIATVDIDGRHL